MLILDIDEPSPGVFFWNVLEETGDKIKVVDTGMSSSEEEAWNEGNEMLRLIEMARE
jgi:hypothetical protein